MKKILVNFRLHDQSKTISLHKSFDIETISFYYTYAKYYGSDYYKNALETLFPVTPLPLDNAPTNLEPEDWEQVCNYFLLYKGLEAYALNDFDTSKRILSVIDENKLSAFDLREYQKVKTRLKYLPVTLKKLINKIK